MAHYCIYCGADINSIGEYCPECGKIVDDFNYEEDENSLNRVNSLADDVQPQRDSASISTFSDDYFPDWLDYNEQDEASSKSSRTNSTDFSRLSRTQKRKKATNRYYIILAGCIFVAALLVVCVIVSLSRKSKPEPNDSSVSTIHTVESPSSYPSVSNRVLPSVENFEQHLANEINDFFAASVIDAEYSGYGIKNYEIPHCSREDGFTSDQAIFCGYGPNSVMGLVATVTGEEVTYVDTMFVLSGAEETEDVLSGIPMLMIPVALFNSNYSDMKK